MSVKERSAFLVGVGVLCVMALPFIAVAVFSYFSDVGSTKNGLEGDLGTDIDPFIKQAIVDLVANEQEAYEISFLTASDPGAPKTMSVNFEYASEEAEKYLLEFEEMSLAHGAAYEESFDRVIVNAEEAPLVEASADGKTIEVVQYIWAEAIQTGMSIEDNQGPGWGDEHVLTFDAKTGELLTLEVRDQSYYDNAVDNSY